MLKELFKSWFPEEAVHRSGASITAECQYITPLSYSDAAKKLAKLSVMGTMKFTKTGELEFELEGPHATIEEIMRSLHSGSLLNVPCRASLVWHPFRSKYTKFIAHPFVVYSKKTSSFLTA